MTTKHRLPLEKSKWFVFNRETSEYLKYGFPTKQTAFTEAVKLNEAKGRVVFAVSPKGPERPKPSTRRPKLKLIQGGLPE